MERLHPPSLCELWRDKQARLLEFGEDVPASFYYAVARKKRLRILSEERLSPHEDIMRDTRGLSRFCLKVKKSGLPLDKNGFMLIQEQRSRVVRFKKQEDKP